MDLGTAHITAGQPGVEFNFEVLHSEYIKLPISMALLRNTYQQASSTWYTTLLVTFPRGHPNSSETLRPTTTTTAATATTRATDTTTATPPPPTTSSTATFPGVYIPVNS